MALQSVGLDATYSIGGELSGVGVYSRQILESLAAAHADCRFLHCYRPHRFFRALAERRPPNARARLLGPPWMSMGACGEVFHGLNQRLPEGSLPPAVSTFHDLFVLSGDYSTPEFRERFAAQARDAARRSDRIVAVSRFTASQVEQLLGVEPARILVIHHGVTPRAAAASGREKMVLFVGALQRRKNVGRLIAAFERAAPAPWRLVLAGSAGFGAAEELQRLSESPARARIEVTGWVDYTRLAGLYACASVFAFPSLDEGFGMPVLEAMASGVPVLASRSSALPEICGAAAVLADPLDTEELTEGLRRLIEDEELRRTLVQAGLRRAAEFTWERAAAATWNLYEEVSR